VLGEENIKYNGTFTSSFYLSRLKDDDYTEIDGYTSGRKTEGWLGEFDYTSYSGWMYCVNGTFPGVGMGDYQPKNGDVMRVQFTVNGYGADVGDDWSGSGVKVADKDKLATSLANINSSSDRNKLLSYKNVRAAYKKANDTMYVIQASQDAVDEANKELNEAVANIENDTKATPMTGISLDQESKEIKVNETVQLNATISPSDTTDDKTITWKTSNSSVATVDEKGLVTTTGEGTCKIYAYAGDCVASCTITVKSETNSDFVIENGVLKEYKGESEDVVIPEEVTAIGDNAFKNCDTIESIVIPSTVKSIGAYAFKACTGLTEITLPEGLETIGDYAFNSCTRLSSLDMPSTLKTIGAHAFDSCRLATSLTLNDDLETIGEYAFNGCKSITGRVTLPSSLQSVPTGIFKGCEALTAVDIPEGVTSIGNYAFYRCLALEDVKIPDKVKTIGDYAFSVCQKITSFDLGDDLETIGARAFNTCSALTEITIPKNVKTIGSCAFNACKELKTVKVYSKDVVIPSDVSDTFLTNDVTFYGYEGSTTEAYAKTNNKTFILLKEAITVTFDADNGENLVTKEVSEDKTLDYTPQAPAKDGYTFVGWYTDTDDITTEFKKDATYDQDVTYKAKYAHVKMLGAQGKIVVDGKSGIRFGTKIYDDGDEIVEKGTLIIPANLLEEGQALILDNKKAARSIGKVNYEVNKDENYVTYLGTIINIPEAQFEREMTAASYVIYRDKAGNEYTVYSQYPNGSISVLDILGNDIDWDDEW
ncbi:leucine-rich repeat protein, partial [Intestinibacter sp.]|uniref:leucine-rich repeat protein n=1 Tax=Intestinibacter sp. TaxID=1965304 RepID=UPI003F144943